MRSFLDSPPSFVLGTTHKAPSLAENLGLLLACLPLEALTGRTWNKWCRNFLIKLNKYLCLSAMLE